MKAPWQSSYPVTYPQYSIACNGWVVKRLLRLLSEPFKKLSRWKLIPPGKISTSVPSQSFKLGKFAIDWQGSETKQPSLQIIHQSNSAKIIWQSSPGCSFVSGGDVRLTIIEERGSIEIDEQKHAHFSDQIVEGIKQEEDTLEISGRLVNGRSTEQAQYVLKLQTVGSKELDFQLQIIDGNVNEIQLQFTTSVDEHFYGFGEQFSHIDCKGQWVPIVCEEGGIGRGDRGPRTLNVLGVAGNRFSSYAPVPYFLTNKGRALFLTTLNPQFSTCAIPKLQQYELHRVVCKGEFFAVTHPWILLNFILNMWEESHRFPIGCIKVRSSVCKEGQR